MVWKISLSIFGLLIAMMLLGAVIKSNPEADAKFKARDAIELCWKDQSRKSLTPNDQRFIAGMCESMEDGFRSKYGVNP